MKLLNNGEKESRERDTTRELEWLVRSSMGQQITDQRVAIAQLQLTK